MMLYAAEFHQQSGEMEFIPFQRQPHISLMQSGSATTGANWSDWPVGDPGTVNWLLIQKGSEKSMLWEDRYGSPSPYAVATHTSRIFDYTTDHVIDDSMSQIEAAALRGDERVFVTILADIDWTSKRPEDFLKAIALALAVGAYLAARNLSQQGADMFPEHLQIQNYARVLAPPKTTRMSTSSNASLNKKRDWLVKHGDEYRGQWVAIQDGQLLGSAASLLDLKRRIDNTAGVLFTKVF